MATLDIVTAVSLLIGLTMIVWRKGWRFFALAPLVISAAAFVVVWLSDNLYNLEYYPPYIFLAYQSVMILMGMFGPKKPFLSKNQRKIMELQKKIGELAKPDEGDKQA